MAEHHESSADAAQRAVQESRPADHAELSELAHAQSMEALNTPTPASADVRAAAAHEQEKMLTAARDQFPSAPSAREQQSEQLPSSATDTTRPFAKFNHPEHGVHPRPASPDQDATEVITRMDAVLPDRRVATPADIQAATGERPPAPYVGTHREGENFQPSLPTEGYTGRHRAEPDQTQLEPVAHAPGIMNRLRRVMNRFLRRG